MPSGWRRPDSNSSTPSRARPGPIAQREFLPVGRGPMGPARVPDGTFSPTHQPPADAIRQDALGWASRKGVPMVPVSQANVKPEQTTDRYPLVESGGETWTLTADHEHDVYT